MHVGVSPYLLRQSVLQHPNKFFSPRAALLHIKHNRLEMLESTEVGIELFPMRLPQKPFRNSWFRPILPRISPSSNSKVKSDIESDCCEAVVRRDGGESVAHKIPLCLRCDTEWKGQARACPHWQVGKAEVDFPES